MLKRFIVMVSLICLLSSYSFAAAGIMLNVGSRASDRNFYNIEIPEFGNSGEGYADADVVNDAILFQGALFYEHQGLFGMKERSSFGVFAGLAGYKNISIEYYAYGNRPIDLTVALKSKGMHIPFGIYYKYKATRKFAFKGGLGATYVNSSWTIDINDKGNVSSDEKNVSALMPRIDAGAELLLSRVFTVGLDFAYTMSGKIECPYDLPEQTAEKRYTDYSGLSVSLALRFYVL